MWSPTKEKEEKDASVYLLCFSTHLQFFSNITRASAVRRVSGLVARQGRQLHVRLCNAANSSSTVFCGAVRFRSDSRRYKAIDTPCNRQVAPLPETFLQLDAVHFSVTDGTVIGVAFKEPRTGVVPASFEDDSEASPAIEGTPAIEDTPADLGAALEEGGPGSTEGELWSARRTRFLISKYKELNLLVGKKGGFKQV